MKKLVAVGLGLAALGGCAATEGSAAAQQVVNVHLRNLPGTDIDPPVQLNIVIGRRDAPARWRAAWGGDGSLAWADRTLDRFGCDVHVWHDGTWVKGLDCDY